MSRPIIHCRTNSQRLSKCTVSLITCLFLRNEEKLLQEMIKKDKYATIRTITKNYAKQGNNTKANTNKKKLASWRRGARQRVEAPIF